MELLKYIVTSYPQLSLNDLATKARAIMRDYGLRVIPVVEKGRLVGVVYRTNVLSTTSSKSNLLVRDIIYEPKVVLKIDDDVKEAILKMLKADEWYAPVVDESNVFKGIFGIDSIIKEFYNKDIPANKRSVEEIMTIEVIYVNDDEELPTVFYKMLKHQYAGLPVLDKKGKVVGIITQHDLLKSGFTRLHLESERASGYKRVKARDIMSVDVVKFSPTATIGDVAKAMVEKDIGRVVIVDRENRLLGIVDREDIVKAYIPYL